MRALCRWRGSFTLALSSPAGGGQVTKCAKAKRRSVGERRRVSEATDEQASRQKKKHQEYNKERAINNKEVTNSLNWFCLSTAGVSQSTTITGDEETDKEPNNSPPDWKEKT